MKIAVKNKTKRFLSWTLILSMGLLVANKAVFFHVHKLSDSSIVSHAHPFNKAQDQSPYKKHQHTDAQFFFLGSLEKLFLKALVVFLFIIPFVQKKTGHYNWFCKSCNE